MITEQFILGVEFAEASVVVDGTVLNALANPSAFGWPDASNTGHQGSTDDLIPVGQIAVHDNDLREDNLVVASRPSSGSTVWGPVTLYPDRTEINLMNLKGRLRNRSVYDLNVANSVLETWDGWTTGHLIDSRNQGPDGHTTLTDCTLNALAARAHTFGHRMTFIRCDISGGEDAIDMWWNVNLYDCYVHDLYRSPDSHNDIFQIGGAGNSGAHHCTLLAAQPSTDSGIEFPDGWYDPMNAIVMVGDYGGWIQDLTFEDCLVDGGNWMFNDNWRGDYPVSNIVVRNNRVGRHYRYGVKSLKDAPTDPNPPTWIWEGNVWDDTGDLIV